MKSLSERATAKIAAPSNDGECPPDSINSEMASYRAKLQDLTENMKNFKKAESLLPGGSWKEALEMENKLQMQIHALEEKEKQAELEKLAESHMDYVVQNTGNIQDDLKILLKYYKDHLYLAENYYKGEGKAEK